jgi:uncharacterized protein (TIGR00255 family)
MEKEAKNKTMPIRSMTGFGRGESRGARFRATSRVRSLNHRHLEITLSLEDPYTLLDRDARARVEAAFQRGKVDAGIHVESLEEPVYSLRVRRGLIEAWVRETESLRSEFNVRERVPFTEALRLPGAVEAVPSETVLNDEDRRDILRALDLAIEDALSMKRTEGEALARDFYARLDSMEHAVNAIAGCADGMVKTYADKLAQRIREWSQDGGLALDEERLLREAALYAERSDIAEELTRLRSHLAQFRALLDADEPGAGRTLDFLVQELHREANTLAAKARFDNVTSHALQLRGDVEKLREQVRNVE